MSFREQLLRELPRLLREDPVLRQAVLELVRPYFAERQVTEDRFERLFEELRHMREESERRWQQHQEEWRQWREESERRWQQHQEEWRQWREESERRWQEFLEKFERRWQQHQEEWRQWREESERRWQQYIQQIDERWEKQQEEIRREFQRVHFTLGAIGARWGQRSEATFRNAAIGLLREYLADVKVQRLQIYDEEGVVFDHPAVVEIDLFVHNGHWILGEIKTAVDREDVFFFVKKARFAESHLGRKADRWIMISPFVTKRARTLLREFGITLYTFLEELEETEQPPEE